MTLQTTSTEEIEVADDIPMFNFGTIPTNKYVLGEWIGEGKFGQVYQVFPNEEPTTSRPVYAMKLFRHDVCHNWIAAIKYEANVTADLHLPQVIRIHEYLVHTTGLFNRPAILMEYYPGIPLMKYLQQTSEPVDFLSLMLQVAQAIDQLHHHGIIHRDIKEDNLLVHQGQVKLIDLGHACRLPRKTSNPIFNRRAEEQYQRRLRMRCGTPLYMTYPAALRLHTRSSECSFQQYAEADVWAFAVTFHNCLHGYYPYDSDKNLEELLSFLARKQRTDPATASRVENFKSHPAPASVHEIIEAVLAGQITTSSALLARLA